MKRNIPQTLLVAPWFTLLGVEAFAATPQLVENPVLSGVLSTILYGMIGIAMMFFAFKLIDLRTPGKLAVELTTEKNTALAIVVGSFTLGVAIIIAAAIAG